MTILTEKFRFIRDDVFLCPQVDTETGKQSLKLEKINLKTGNIEQESWIDCIHTAITQIAYDELIGYQEDTNFKNELIKKTLNIRSSENLIEINLSPDEKFKALKSWSAGIAEAGLNAFKIQGDIDGGLDFIYPISFFLMQFLVKIDSDFIHQFLFLIEKECMFEGKAHDASIISNLIPLVEMITHEWQDPLDVNVEDITEETTKMIDGILDFNPPIDLFNHETYYPHLFLGASLKSLKNFLDNIENSDGWIEFLENFEAMSFIKAKLSQFDSEKLLKKILTLDLPLRVFNNLSILLGEIPEGLYQFYAYYSDLTVDFIKRALKKLQNSSKASIVDTDLIYSLNPVLHFLYALKNYEYNGFDPDYYEKSEQVYEEILYALFDVKPPLKLIINPQNNSRDRSLLKHPGAKKIRISSEDFVSRFTDVSYFLIEHPNATEFTEFQKLFNPELERNFDIRIKSLKRWIKDHPELQIDFLTATCIPKKEIDCIKKIEEFLGRCLENIDIDIRWYNQSTHEEEAYQKKFASINEGYSLADNHVVFLALNIKWNELTFSLANLSNLKLLKFQNLNDLFISDTCKLEEIEILPSWMKCSDSLEGVPLLSLIEHELTLLKLIKKILGNIVFKIHRFSRMDLFHTSTHTFVTSADFHVAINSGHIEYIEINNRKDMKYDAEIFKKLKGIFSKLSKLNKIVFFRLNDVNLQRLFEKEFQRDKSIEFQRDKSIFAKNRRKIVF